MASNKFASMLHRNTNKITIVLIYAVLEWILIILLLLNSLFSYLIMKFASFFGLKSPCLWCSRIDHVLEPEKCMNSYRGLVCETHATEISKLGFCLNHRKLADAGNMCEDCSSSRPSQSKTDCRIAFFSLIKEMGKNSSDSRSKIETGEKDLKCSCCGVNVGSEFYSPYLLFKPSWGVLDYTQKGNLIKNQCEEYENFDGFSDDKYLDPIKSECAIGYDKDEIRNRDGEAENQMLSDISVNKVVEETEDKEDDECSNSPPSSQSEEIKGDEIWTVKSQQEPVDDDSRVHLEGTAILPPSDDNDILNQVCVTEDSSCLMLTTRLGECSDDSRFIPIKLIDSTTLRNQNSSNFREDELLDAKSEIHKEDVPVVATRSILEDKVVVLPTNESEDDTISTKLEISNENECSSLFPAEDPDADLGEEICNQVAIAQATQISARDGTNVEEAEMDFDEPQVSEENNKMEDTVDQSESFTEREIFHEDTMDCHQIHESIPSLECLQKDQSSKDNDDAGGCTTSDELAEDEDRVPEPAKKLATDGEDCFSASQPVLKIELVKSFEKGENHHLSTCSELNEAGEERAPETPTYMGGIHTLQKRLLFGKKESGTESLDGSTISDIDGCEGVSIDRLKTALKAERRVLSALYGELEEERSASAIAANQTMAMITRLQEEKAAMQMETLQYQRMMEEQSEYDQEALQLLNELMVKREKEKQELEKELELYRKKVLHYEAKEKRMVKKSASSSAEDSDELSIDLNEGDDSFYGLQESTQNTPQDEVLSLGMGQESAKHLGTLDESLDEFEEERLSILEKLKTLEEKLFTLDDEEEHFEDVKAIEHFSEYNGQLFSENYELCDENENGIPNGFSEELGTNGNHHHERRNIGSKAKRLLPLFDAIGMENEDGLPEEQDPSVISQNSDSKFNSCDTKLVIEEEMDNVYERLQVLEADREFLKHSISSLKKGDKGMELLQEILQHLRSLRTVELRVKNTSNALS
ncbi:myosin-binding protein 3-like [Tasmannia lanceolata]|uniref:myosin-binding protein 3-like n=1 Tax=Tasmannia lanceolata TaxID=3420 RepID=UPI004063760D